MAAALALLLCTGSADAVGPPRVDVEYRDGALRFSMEAQVSGRPADIEAVLYDYDALDRLLPMVVESRRLYAPAPGVDRIRQKLRGCALGICREFQHVADVRRSIDGGAQAVIVAGRSAIEQGLVVWRLNAPPGCTPGVPGAASRAACDVTQLRLDGELRVALMLPPWVGPALVRYAVRREFIDSLERIERAARSRSAFPGAVGFES